jgi:hypothetical protein
MKLLHMSASQHPKRYFLADACRKQRKEIVSGSDRLAIQRQAHIPDENARRFSGTVRRDAHDQQTPALVGVSALTFRESHWLTGNPEEADARPAVLEHVRRALPRERRGNYNGQTAYSRVGGDADNQSRCVHHRTSGKSIVHRCGDANDLLQRVTAAAAQRSTDHGHDAGARSQSIAPRSSNRKGELPDPRRGVGDGRRSERQVADAEDGKSTSGIPSDQFSGCDSTIARGDADAIFSPERSDRRQHDIASVGDTAHWPTMSMDLYDRWRDRLDDVRKLIRKCD